MVKLLLLKTSRDLRSSLAQSIALIVIVALGISSFVALVGAYRDLSTSYNHTYQQLKFADVTLTLQGAPRSVVDQVAQIEGVAAVTGRLLVDGGLQLPAAAAQSAPAEIRARLIGISPDQHPQVNDVFILNGRFLKSGDEQAALLESHFAQAYGLEPGDHVTPIVNGQPVDFDVVGIAASPEYLIVSPSKQEIIPSARTFAVLFVPLAALQKLTSVGDSVNEVDIRLADHANQDNVIQAVQSKLQAYGLQATTLQKDQPSNSALQLDLEGYHEIAYLMPGLILLVAAASVYLMLGRLVRAQQPQIGLMKALGYGDRTVMAHYLALALVIGVIGSIVGVLLGFPLVNEITTEYAGELGIPLVQTQFYPDLVILGVLLSLIFSGLAGIGPARHSAKMAPAQAMRLDPASALVKGRTSIFERLIRLPFWLRLPVRNVFRVRSRALSTGLGVVFAFVLILASVGMLDSMRQVIQDNFEVVERWDELASFSAPQNQGTIDQIKGWTGVRQVEPLIQMPATLKVGAQNEDILLTAFSPTQKMHALQLTQGASPEQALAAGHLVITTGMATKFKLRPGDTVSVESALGTRQFVIGGTSDELMSAAAFISLDEAQQWAGSQVPFFKGVYLNADPSRPQQIESELYHLPNVIAVQLKSDTERDWNSLMDLFYVFMGVILAFAVATAFALLFNAMTVSVLERQREFATMRAVGTGGRRIALLMTTENVILWLVALIPGLLLGTFIASEMGTAISSDLFSLTVAIAPASYVLTALGILITMIVAALPAIRRVNRLNLAEATKVLT